MLWPDPTCGYRAFLVLNMPTTHVCKSDVVLRHTLPVFIGLGRCPIVNWDFDGAVSIFWTGCPSSVCQTSLPVLSEACTTTQAAVCETRTLSKSSAACGRLYTFTTAVPSGHRLCHETRYSRAKSRHSVDSWQPIDRFGLCR